MPNIPPGNLQELVKELHELHRRAGWPSVREMAKGKTFTYALVHDLFTRTSKQAPRMDVTLQVVHFLACRVRKLDLDKTLDRFDALWQEASKRPFAQAIDERQQDDVSVGHSAAHFGIASREMPLHWQIDAQSAYAPRARPVPILVNRIDEFNLLIRDFNTAHKGVTSG
jgi:hypothetical protein